MNAERLSSDDKDVYDAMDGSAYSSPLCKVIVSTATVTQSLQKHLSDLAPSFIKISTQGIHRPVRSLRQQFIRVTASADFKERHVLGMLRRDPKQKLLIFIDHRGAMRNLRNAMEHAGISQYSAVMAGGEGVEDAMDDSEEAEIEEWVEAEQSEQELDADSNEELDAKSDTESSVALGAMDNELSFHADGSSVLSACLYDCIHGDLSKQRRKEVFEAFSRGEFNILLTTDLLSRGIDFQDVDQVILYSMPSNPVDYLHRIGRTARCGRPGNVTTFVTRKTESMASKVQDLIRHNKSLGNLRN